MRDNSATLFCTTNGCCQLPFGALCLPMPNFVCALCCATICPKELQLAAVQAREQPQQHLMWCSKSAIEVRAELLWNKGLARELGQIVNKQYNSCNGGPTIGTIQQFIDAPHVQCPACDAHQVVEVSWHHTSSCNLCTKCPKCRLRCTSNVAVESCLLGCVHNVALRGKGCMEFADHDDIASAIARRDQILRQKNNAFALDGF